MRYCPNCGTEAGDSNQFCHSCGERLSKPQSQPQYQQNSYESNDYQSYQSYTAPTVSKKNAVISFIFGLINIELFLFSIFPYLCFFFFPASLILSIIGIKKSKQYVKEAGQPHAFSKIGKILCIISLVLACIFFVFGMIFSFIPEAAGAFYEAFLEAYGFDISTFNTSYGSGSGGSGSYGGGYYTTIFNL